MKKEQMQQRTQLKPAHSRQTAKPKPQPESPMVSLQNQLGNGAVQRFLAQRSGDGAFDLEDDTAGRINRLRGGGQALDGAVQAQMGEAMGADFSGVRVHTGAESHHLNEQLGAKAFTTGQDLFFREGAYSPTSSSGQELLAHELTHVVQQSAGVVGSGGSAMRVNAPGDQFEQEADAMARQITSGGGGAAPAAGVQRQELPEEEELQAKRLQRQELPEEEELQAKRLQRQELPEEEEMM